MRVLLQKSRKKIRFCDFRSQKILILYRSWLNFWKTCQDTWQTFSWSVGHFHPHHPASFRDKLVNTIIQEEEYLSWFSISILFHFRIHLPEIYVAQWCDMLIYRLFWYFGLSLLKFMPDFQIISHWSKPN